MQNLEPTQSSSFFKRTTRRTDAPPPIMTTTTQQNSNDNDEDSTTARAMTRLQDSVVSKLKNLNPSLSIEPHHSSLIQHRLQKLFPAFHTPTHPPYALMICNAIIGLEEGTGSTEKAISEFIEREYDDLPWAHGRILSLQLEKLCEIGEIESVSGGRYVVMVEDSERKQCSKSSQKKKRGERRSKRGEGKSVQEKSEEGRLQVIRKQSNQHAEAEAEAQCGLGESQIQDSRLHLETTCSSQPTALKCIPAAANPLLPAPLQLQMPCNGPSESGVDAAAKMSGSLSLNVEECKQDENPMTGHSDHQSRGRKPRKCKQIADHQEESLLPSGDSTVIQQEPNEKKIHGRGLSRPQGRGKSRGRGRGLKLRRNAHHIDKKMHPHDHADDLECSSHLNKKETSPSSQPAHDHADDLECSSHLNKKETSSSSQPAAPNSPVNPTHDIGKQLVVPTSEGSPECVVSTGLEFPSIQLQQQVYSDIDLGTVSKRKASSTSENDHDGLPQHYNQGSPKGDLDEDPMSGGSEQKPPKRRRGRPPKLEAGANNPGKSLLPSDDDIHDEQWPNKMEKQHQYGRGRGRGRVKFGRGRGQGRPPKLNQNEEQLQQGDQDQQHGRGRGIGRGRGRGRGRPPKLKENPIQYEEQLQQEDQPQQHTQGRGRGRPRKLIQDTNICEAQLPQEVQAKQQRVQVQGRGRGRPLKPKENTNQYEEQAQDQAQGLVNSSEFREELQPEFGAEEVEGTKRGEAS